MDAASSNLAYFNEVVQETARLSNVKGNISDSSINILFKKINKINMDSLINDKSIEVQKNLKEYSKKIKIIQARLQDIQPGGLAQKNLAQLVAIAKKIDEKVAPKVIDRKTKKEDFSLQNMEARQGISVPRTPYQENPRPTSAKIEFSPIEQAYQNQCLLSRKMLQETLPTNQSEIDERVDAFLSSHSPPFSDLFNKFKQDYRFDQWPSELKKQSLKELAIGFQCVEQFMQNQSAQKITVKMMRKLGVIDQMRE